ncbi:Gfo/Idh/MocA family protein [Paenibacillus sp. GCM10023250]|uniref:Gfo/Idh/MocA family protein n=1 Tax=Paenibacillus sp. GCM10023250 TaxID=3252648 RepID=UPI00360A1838
MTANKVGFIDYFLDEWHANNYPGWIRQESGGRWDVALAWAEVDAPPEYDPDKNPARNTTQWCTEHGVERAASISELIERCDAVVVLSPDHPQHHERLADEVLRSGKPVYVDKTFAINASAAAGMFKLAATYGTPLFSSSALRFARELEPWQARRDRAKENRAAFVCGGGAFDNYAVHSFEMLTVMMGTGETRLKAFGGAELFTYIVDYGSGRQGTVVQPAAAPFQASYADANGNTEFFVACTDYFPRLILELLRFFESSEAPVASAETIGTMALIDAARMARQRIGEWVEL